MRRILSILGIAAVFTGGLPAHAQSPTPEPTSAPVPAPYSEQTLAELARLQQSAVRSDYAYRQVAHLANNIGPRLSGSPQAQKAVDYVAAEMRALGMDVTLEPVMVPHWVRGEETAALVEFPGQAEGTTQKIVLTALGPSVATPPAGLTAEVVAVKDFHELAVLGRAKVAGKIVLFNHPFDQQMAAVGQGLDAYGQAVVYRSTGPSAAARFGAVAALVRSVGGAAFRLPHAGQTRLRARRAGDPGGSGRRGRRRPAGRALRRGSRADAPRADPAAFARGTEFQRHRGPQRH